MIGTRGRDSELAALTRAVDDAAAGRGGIVLLAGEAGIGKSRLASDTLAHAKSQGLTVLQGQAHPLHSGLAYAPIVEALRPHLATVTDHGAPVDPDSLADLGRLLADPRLPRAEPLGDPELERTRMYEAVARLVRHLAPAILFIDDLHWADRGTIELVHYVGHGARDQNVLVLVAYRPRTALADLAAGARRDGNEIRLEPLTDTAVAELTRDLLGNEPTEDLLRGVTTRAKGIPLFVTALVRSRATMLQASTLPVIVRDVVLSRLHQLDEQERRLVEIVAVAGDSGSPRVLQALWQHQELDTVLRRLILDGLITEHTAGRSVFYRVAHPLYAEVAYAELTISERRNLHAAIARTIDAQTPDDVLALAPHYREAGDLVDADRAVEVMAEAGWRAMAVLDADEAVQYLGAAAQTARPELVPSLLEGLGRAHQARGSLEDAATAWTSAAKLASGELLASLRRRLALLESERGNSAVAWRHSEAATTTGSAPDAITLKMIFTIRHGDRAAIKAIADEMIAFADTDPSSAGQAVAYQGQIVRAMHDSAIDKALQAARQALVHADACASEAPIHMQSVRRMLVWLSIATGDIPAALEHATVGHGELVRFEIPSAICAGQYGLAAAHYFSGDLNAAIEEIGVGERTARGAGLARSLARMLSFRSILLAEQGLLAEAEACSTKAKKATVQDDPTLVSLANLADTVLAIHSGRPAEAPMTIDPLSLNEPLRCIQPFLVGLCHIATGNDERLAMAIANLRQVGRAAPFLDSLADRLDGLRNADADLLARTANRLDRMGARLLAAQARLEWAELISDRESTLQCFETFEWAGAGSWLERCRRHARAVGVRIAPARKTGLLSNREAQVVQLLGEGLSNADIAARLFLSERTVETHLRNSYAKLGITSRIALARWAAEN